MVHVRKYANVADVGGIVVEGGKAGGVYRRHFCGCEDRRELKGSVLYLLES